MPLTTVPIKDPDRGWRFWYIDEIFTGPSDPGPYVPNPNDAVLSWTEGLYRVVSVDYDTGLSVLELKDFSNNNNGILAEDILLSSGPGSQSEAFRLYINTDVTPPTMAFDARLFIRGSRASYVKVFRGVDTSVTGHVISGIFSGMTLTSENIPLETVVTPGVGIVAVKTPEIAWSIEALNDNEPVTCVVYDDADEPISVFKMYTKITNFIKSTDTSKKYVIAIELLTNYLSLSDDHLVEVPLNMTLQSMGLLGKVTYSDGSSETLPIDNTRFRLHGINAYIPTVLGQTVDLVLAYTLQPDEYGYIAGAPTPDRVISEPYKVTTIEAAGAYSVKLFVVPKWVALTSRWDLDFYLYSLDRDQIFLATPYIEYTVSSPSFDGTLVNVPQRLTVAVNLNNLDPGYNLYRFPQTFTITLKGSGSNANLLNYWHLEYTPDHFFGSGNYAVASLDVNPLNKRLDISLNLADVGDWLNKVYYPIEPLRFPDTEAVAPTPTHVRVKVGPSWVRELTLLEALQSIDGITSTIVQGNVVRLEFIKRDGLTDYELGMSSMTIKF